MPFRPALTFSDPERRNAATLIELALAEDLDTATPAIRLEVPPGRLVLEVIEPLGEPGDVTSRVTIPAEARGAARFVARREGILAGMPVLRLVAHRFGLGTFFEELAADGDRLAPGQAVAAVAGPMREILAFERTALNFLQRLSGVATLTDRYVRAVAGTKAAILDTRKTTPGWRYLEKYAVRCGGGRNHRIGLHDAVLIKDNHLAWRAFLGDADPIAAAVGLARAQSPRGMTVEVEVDSLAQLDRALAARPDIVLIDNFPVESVPEAVRRRDSAAPGVLLEVSGGVNLDTVGAYARAGVDRISVGALTHSAPALDIGLDFAS
jgi:nicotinate-nucleotide pyrophosphorylase (carboxylating)